MPESWPELKDTPLYVAAKEFTRTMKELYKMSGVEEQMSSAKKDDMFQVMSEMASITHVS